MVMLNGELILVDSFHKDLGYGLWHIFLGEY